MAGKSEKAKKADIRLRLIFRFSFAITFVFITLALYGFVLLMRDSLHQGRQNPGMIGSMMQQGQGTSTVTDGNGNPIQEDPRATEEMRRNKGQYEVNATTNTRKLTVKQIIEGVMRGEEYPTAVAYLLVGLLLTTFFGVITIILYWNVGDFSLTSRPPPERFTDRKAFTQLDVQPVNQKPEEEASGG